MNLAWNTLFMLASIGILFVVVALIRTIAKSGGAGGSSRFSRRPPSFSYGSISAFAVEDGFWVGGSSLQDGDVLDCNFVVENQPNDDEEHFIDFLSAQQEAERLGSEVKLDLSDGCRTANLALVPFAP